MGYTPLTGKLFISRDVNFDEVSTWNWSKKEKNFFSLGQWDETEENGTPTAKWNPISTKVKSFQQGQDKLMKKHQLGH